MIKRVRSDELYIGRLPHGVDLLDEITAVCIRLEIRLGRIEALGAVEHARLAYYDQHGRTYNYFTLVQPLEITKLVGNVSLRDGWPVVHAHITLADETGRAYGGHLAQGTKVFACEYIIETFDGPALEREYDEITGLPLWSD